MEAIASRECISLKCNGSTHLPQQIPPILVMDICNCEDIQVESN